MSATTERPRLMESTPVARELAISVTRLHQLADRLNPPVLRTTSGRRIFREEDVIAIREAREARKRADVAPTAA